MSGVPQGLPRPEMTPHTAPFWDACSEGRLVVQRCEDCGCHRHPPGPLCASCGSTRVRWVESTGMAEIFSFVVVHHPVHPSLQNQVPYNIVVARLEDCGKILITSNVLDCEPDALRVGLRIRFKPERVGDGIAVPRFVPFPA